MKKYRVTVTQTDTFMKEFVVEAESKEEAEDKVQADVDECPIDMSNTAFQGCDVEVEAEEITS